MKTNHQAIEIRPLELKWSEWRNRCSKLDDDVKAVAHERAPQPLLAAVSKWNAESRAWLSSLSENRKRDLVALAEAEAHFLWMEVHDERRVAPAGECLESLRLDFRERWFVLLPLVVMLRDLGIGDVTISDVDAEATKCEWLP